MKIEDLVSKQINTKIDTKCCETELVVRVVTQMLDNKLRETFAFLMVLQYSTNVIIMSAPRSRFADLKTIIYVFCFVNERRTNEWLCEIQNATSQCRKVPLFAALCHVDQQAIYAANSG